MRIILGVFLFILSVEILAFPEVKSWENSPVVVFDDKTQAVLVKKGLLKRPFAVATSTHDHFELSLNFFDLVYLYEKSKLQVLDFSTDDGLVTDLYLIDGRMRFSSDFKGADKNRLTDLIIKTAFFDLKITKPVDFVIDLNMQESRVDVKIIKGQLPLEFFSYEKKITLNEGQQVRFQGVMSDDKLGIKYDFLLDGKKVPKGNLNEVQAFDHSHFLKIEAAKIALDKKRKKTAELRRLEKKRKQKEYEDSFLCKKPFGHKDQCSWKIEEAKCIRRRCNVNGQWGDKTERPIGVMCKPDFVVDVCDY